MINSNALINNILDLSKIEAGKMTLNATQFDFYSLLNEIEDLLHITAENKGLSLIFDHQDDVQELVCQLWKELLIVTKV